MRNLGLHHRHSSFPLPRVTSIVVVSLLVLLWALTSGQLTL